MHSSPSDYFRDAQVSRRVAINGQLNAPSLEKQVSALYGLLGLAAKGVLNAYSKNGIRHTANYVNILVKTVSSAQDMHAHILAGPSYADMAAEHLAQVGEHIILLGRTMLHDFTSFNNTGLSRSFAETLMAAGAAAYEYACRKGVLLALPGSMNTSGLVDAKGYVKELVGLAVGLSDKKSNKKFA